MSSLAPPPTRPTRPPWASDPGVLRTEVVAGPVVALALIPEDGTHVVYVVDGQVFFASSNDLVHQFDDARDRVSVSLDMTAAHVWDASSVAALDAITTTTYAQRGKTVQIVGRDEGSATRHRRLAGQLGSH